MGAWHLHLAAVHRLSVGTAACIPSLLLKREREGSVMAGLRRLRTTMQ
jgi:hypothetical protein